MKAGAMTMVAYTAVIAVEVAAWWWMLTHEGCMHPLGNLVALMVATMIAPLARLAIHEEGDGDLDGE